MQDSQPYITIEEMDRIEDEAQHYPMTDHRGATLVMRFTRDGQPWAMTREQRCAALRVFFKLRTFAPLSVGIALPADDWRGFAPRGIEAIRSSRTGYRYCYELAHPQDAGQSPEVRS